MYTAPHFSSTSTNWITPPDVYAPLDARFGFALDVCAADDTAARAAVFIPPEIDTLTQRWRDWLPDDDAWCWMNPVYGDAEQPCEPATCTRKRCVARGRHNAVYVPGILDFCRHAVLQWQRDRVRSVWLVPARTDTYWWHATAWNAARGGGRYGSTHLLGGRIRFLDPVRGVVHHAPFPSALVVIGGDYAHLLDDRGCLPQARRMIEHLTLR